MTTLPTPTQLVTGMSHREMVDIMASNGVFCSVDKFARILQDAQRRALAHTTTKEEKETVNEVAR
jgi:predicted transcriptional regulator